MLIYVTLLQKESLFQWALYIRGAYIEGTLPPDFLMNTADGEADFFDLLAMTRNLTFTLRCNVNKSYQQLRMQNYSIWKKVKENSLCFKKIPDRFCTIPGLSVANW